jgi:hypothetical protein
MRVNFRFRSKALARGKPRQEHKSKRCGGQSDAAIVTLADHISICPTASKADPRYDIRLYRESPAA